MGSWATGLSFPEGPVLLGNGDILLVEMGDDAGCLSIIDAQSRKKRQLVKTGRPNGLALDRQGNIWIAESKKPTLLKATLEGDVEVVMDHCDSHALLFPNDLAFDQDGLLFMTDSGILHSDFVTEEGIRADYATAPYDGKVFQIDIHTNETRLIDDGLLFPNGIAIGPDGLLYVNETITGNVYRYGRKGKWFDRSKRSLFGNVIRDDGEVYYRGPDGMKFGSSGALYCTVYGQGDVTVLDSKGSVIKRILTDGLCPTNIVFNRPGKQEILVTEVENGVLECHSVGEDGQELFYG